MHPAKSQFFDVSAKTIGKYDFDQYWVLQEQADAIKTSITLLQTSLRSIEQGKRKQWEWILKEHLRAEFGGDEIKPVWADAEREVIVIAVTPNNITEDE